MDKLQQLIHQLFSLLDVNFFLSREFNKIFTTHDNVEQMAQDKQYKELATKLIEFILSIHKSNQQSVLQEKIAQTHKLLNNYQSQVILQQQKEIPQLNNQTQKQHTTESFKSNSITPRDQQANNRRTSKNQSLTDKRQFQQQITVRFNIKVYFKLEKKGFLDVIIPVQKLRRECKIVIRNKGYLLSIYPKWEDLQLKMINNEILTSQQEFD